MKPISLFLFAIQAVSVNSFSIEKNGNEAASFTLFDRFRPSCPATSESIRQYDPSLDITEDSVWVAVYRSSNNSPSVLIRDEFAQAMRSATGAFNSNNNDAGATEGLESPLQAKAPVAVARLRPAEDQENLYVMDCMRCMLKKEKRDPACDGGSEHCEALAVAIDALLQHHLANEGSFEGAIRTKATLTSGPLLEDRGFVEVTTLQRDMASHTSSLDACMEKYAQRSVSTDTAKSPGSRQRALEIVSLLGRLDREQEMKENSERQGDDDEPVDPLAGFKQFL